MARSIARQAAMQLLYARLSGGDDDEQSLEMVYEQVLERMPVKPEEPIPTEEDRAYISDVLAGVARHEDEIYRVIGEKSKDWSVERMAHVDLSILSVATYELYSRDDVPDNVAVSEAMELATLYSEPKSGRFINGVLGAIARGKQEG